jgi:hypothetical protein
MIFVTQPDIGRIVLNELHNAIDVRLAMAYFNPDKGALTALRDVPRLTLIISEEFTINDPYKLEELPSTATVRSVPADSENGKLHAKVLVVKRPDGDLWVLVGSANMTWQGLFSNQEACVVLESRNTADRTAIDRITDWFDSLLNTARSPDLEAAKTVFNSRSQYRLERRPVSTTTTEATTRYWALKCTSGSLGEVHWPSFLSEHEIAIGWPDIGVDPSGVSKLEIRDAIADAYPDEMDATGAADKITKFVELNIGDIVLICRGFPSNSREPVHIYGIARVTGPFRDDRSSKWAWRFKHDAVIQQVQMYLPKEVVATALGKGSLLGAINALDRSGIERLVEQLGVPLEV